MCASMGTRQYLPPGARKALACRNRWYNLGVLQWARGNSYLREAQTCAEAAGRKLPKTLFSIPIASPGLRESSQAVNAGFEPPAYFKNCHSVIGLSKINKIGPCSRPQGSYRNNRTMAYTRACSNNGTDHEALLPHTGVLLRRCCSGRLLNI